MTGSTVAENTRPQVGSRVRITAAENDEQVGRVGYVYDVQPDGACHVADGDIDGPENGWTWMAWTPCTDLEVLLPQRAEAL